MKHCRRRQTRTSSPAQPFAPTCPANAAVLNGVQQRGNATSTESALHPTKSFKITSSVWKVPSNTIFYSNNWRKHRLHVSRLDPQRTISSRLFVRKGCLRGPRTDLNWWFIFNYHNFFHWRFFLLSIGFWFTKRQRHPTCSWEGLLFFLCGFRGSLCLMKGKCLSSGDSTIAPGCECSCCQISGVKFHQIVMIKTKSKSFQIDWKLFRQLWDHGCIWGHARTWYYRLLCCKCPRGRRWQGERFHFPNMNICTKRLKEGRQATGWQATRRVSSLWI